jgi:dihydropteroate synthase
MVEVIAVQTESGLSSPSLRVRDQVWVWGNRTYLMGILNVTPDSFSDGGQFNTLETAIAQATAMVAQGADSLDIGGQSARPNADAISEQEELQRVIPVITALRSPEIGLDIPISVDTTRATVARAAIAAGADFINDISGGMFDTRMLPSAAELGVPIVLMHMRGTPKTMQQMTEYQDVVVEVRDALQERVTAALDAGIARSQIILDPGIGFAKTVEQNLVLLRSLPQLRALGYPLLVGTSRKSFIGHILNQPDPQQRIWGTAATCCAAIAGQADILRVHDVGQIQDISTVADAIWRQ